VTLAEEIALQRLYLDIEKVRFPRRLKVEIDIPPELESARLPALILQPIVENAIKYAVSPARDKVILRITAREIDPARLHVEISNSSTTTLTPDARPDGTGVGLTNVSQRLAARFDGDASCEFGPTADGGYRVAMTLPLNRSDG
jgi:LytS/YehU family sensor histidine kinase